MQVDVNKLLANDTHLKIPALRNLVKEVMIHPEQNKAEICKKIEKIKEVQSNHFEKVAFVVRRIWHRLLMTFSKTYREKFNHAITILKLSVQQNASAVKVQKVFRGHVERNKVKQIKNAQKQELALKVQATVRTVLQRKKFEKELAAQREANALKQLSQLRRKNRVLNNFTNITRNLSKKEVEAAEKTKAELNARLDAFIKYRDALASVEQTKASYEKFNESTGSAWLTWLTFREDKMITEGRTSAKAAYDEAVKQLAAINSAPPVLGFTGKPDEEISQLKNNISALADKIQRMNRVHALTEYKPPLPKLPNPPQPAPLPPAKPAAAKNPEPPKAAEPKQPPGQAPVQDPYALQGLKSPKGKMLSALYAGIHRDMKQIWEQFFKKCDPNDSLILDWTCDNQGKFQIKLNEPLKMWVPSVNEQGVEDPKGGVVLMLGEPEKLVTGNIDAEKKTLNFDNGFSIHCRYPIPLHGEMAITPKVFRMVYENKDRVLFGAGIELFGKKLFRDRVKSVDNLVANWGKNGITVKGDHEKYLLDKMHPPANSNNKGG